MSKPEMSTEQIAQDAYTLMDSEFGRWYVETLREQAGIHEKASKDISLSAEAKAFHIERATGIELAIEVLEDRASQHKP